MNKNKVKVDTKVVLSLIELLDGSYDEEDQSNFIMGYTMLANLNWNPKSKMHIFYMEMFWYLYLGPFISRESPIYKIERLFVRNGLSKVGGFKNTCISAVIDEKNLMITKNFCRKYRAFGKKNGVNEYKSKIKHFLD